MSRGHYPHPTVDVPAGSPTGVSTRFTLRAGARYLVTASATYQYGGGWHRRSQGEEGGSWKGTPGHLD